MEPSDYWALAEFRFQLRIYVHRTERAAEAEGLGPQQHQLLLALKGLPAGRAPTIRAAAERLHIAHHSAVELVDRCVEQGLIRRARSTEDHREVRLSLTALGERRLHRVSASRVEELRTAGRELVRALQGVIRLAGRRRRNGAPTA